MAGAMAFLLAAPAHPLPQDRNTQSPNDASFYFPKDTLNQNVVSFFSGDLSFLGEPSLLADSRRDATTVSYRLTCKFCQEPNLLVIRILLNADGDATITTTTAALHSSGPPTVGDKTQRTVTADQLAQLSRSIEKANFWSMPSTDPEDAKFYKLHASQWLFEGVRGGAYHVVFREGPKPSAFTEMVRLLAKDLAKLDDSHTPYAQSVLAPSGARPTPKPH